MTFDEILSKTRAKAAEIDAAGVDFLAVQVNFKDIDGGVLYVEIKNGCVRVEPYDYHDRSCGITLTAGNFAKLLDGKLDPVAAFTLGRLKVDGDVGKALAFSKLLKQ